MTLGTTRYNERSWAIDLIGHLKQLSKDLNRSVKDAGGEQTINVGGGSLFPDVLLFGDRSTARILQGWELKMPETRIDDPVFRVNAEQKARALGLDSFVLWNVSHAHLYTKDQTSDRFSCTKQWNELADITTRTSVTGNRGRWEHLAAEILGFINDLFDRGSLEGRQFIDAYKSGGITGLIMENAPLVKDALEEASVRDAKMKAEVILWWQRHSAEYGKSAPFEALAKANISNWIGKFLFAHILREQDQRAQAVADIQEETSPIDALEIFKNLSQTCNFWTIFSDSIGLSVIPEKPWKQLKEFNKLLKDLRVGSIEQSQLSGVLEATVEVAVRKLRGQYPTPPELARLLVQLNVRNIAEDRVLDPCCGSGTIARAALEQKIDAGVLPNKAAASVFAGDQDPQAVQIATFALAKPTLMHIPLRIFQKNAFDLTPETELAFRDPSDGNPFVEQAGKFNAIVSNLPFVGQDGREPYNESLKKVSDSFEDTEPGLPKTADVSAYLPFSLHPLLELEGRLGIIITNAWLGTGWGDAFFKLLCRYYKVKTVITSGAGRWFQNSAVVTNILLMEKQEGPTEDDDHINFVVLKRPAKEFSDQDAISLAAAQIELGQSQDETITIRSVTKKRLDEFQKYGLRGNSQFVNCDWVLDLPMRPLTDFFDLERGERRGWDEMFYPKKGTHAIEAEYIKPVLKSSKEIKDLITKAESDAFCCDLSLNELQEKSHTGALEWIKRFESGVNKTGIPLVKALAKSGSHWYQMSDDSLAELVIPINYGDRLFVSRLETPSFVNQRLISLIVKEGTNTELMHALLNSAVSMFVIEGMGFGRGEGVLDLSKNRIENFMHILDPDQLSEEKKMEIIKAFSPLLQRNILEIADELEQNDRQNFDDVVIKAFNLSVTRERIYESVLMLVGIRQTATVSFE